VTGDFHPAWQRWVMALLLLASAGCATVPPGTTQASDIDPWEEWNRKVFAFNETLDETILLPVATVYAEVVPPLARRGIGNFYANLADAWSAVNNLLQAKPVEAFEVAFRFGVNTVFGFAGVLDIASEMDVERHFEDFGQTLGVWGLGTGAYLVWPLIGPSTERDSLALPLNYAASPMGLFNIGLAAQFGVWSLQLVNTRAGLLDAARMLDDMALDKYTFVRDAYLQRRRSLVRDGDEPPPADPSKDDPEVTPAAASPLPPAASAASEAAK
jgi:phospholipid-binding lipoprotein MlaA